MIIEEQWNGRDTFKWRVNRRFGISIFMLSTKNYNNSIASLYFLYKEKHAQTEERADFVFHYTHILQFKYFLEFKNKCSLIFRCSLHESLRSEYLIDVTPSANLLDFLTKLRDRWGDQEYKWVAKLFFFNHISLGFISHR